MSARSSHHRKILGEGTFGLVKNVDGKARKTFTRGHLDEMIQEVVVTKYMNDSPYTVKMLDYSLELLTMDTQLWDTSLKDVMERRTRDMFTFEEKKSIFRQLLIGLTHLHTRLIIHSDFKPSNILINIKEVKVCICDMGLSSTTKYAKVDQTARAYSHKVVVPYTVHDMFGLAMTMTEFLGDFKIVRSVSPTRLRYHIRQHITDPKIQEVLLAMSPNDPLKAITAKQALEKLFGKTDEAEIIIPEAKSFPSKIDERDLSWIKKEFSDAMEMARINRDGRCFFAFFIYVNNPNNPHVPPEDYTLYMEAFMILFSSVFGEFGYGIEAAKMGLSNKRTEREIYQALRNVLSDDNVINFIMMPDFRKPEF